MLTKNEMCWASITKQSFINLPFLHPSKKGVEGGEQSFAHKAYKAGCTEAPYGVQSLKTLFVQSFVLVLFSTLRYVDKTNS